MRGRRLLLHLANRAYRATLAAAARRFALAANAPAAAQAERLAAVLARARGTAFGREHGLAGARTLADYQAAVPARGWDALTPWLDRTWQGEPDVLVPGAPGLFERSSGSTRAAKHVPYTPGLLAEFSAATGPWLHDLLSRRPALLGGSAYWSISPAGPRTERSPGGARVGLEDDTEYFPAPVRRLLRVLLPVPPEVARLPSLDACRYVSLLHLAADPRLALLSVWSPSFLLLLLDALEVHTERLAHDLARGTLSPPGGAAPAALAPSARPDRARALREATRGGLDLAHLWPRLALVSCWTDGPAARLVPALRRRLPPSVEVQGKGLLATEGVVSFPLCDRGAVLAVASHLLELEPTDASGPPVLPHEAEPGRRYAPLLSTAGGLFRYRLGDEVEVTGRVAATPTVRFVGRLDGVSDLAGEKLSPGFVEAALAAALAEARVEAAFTLVAPLAAERPPCYALFVEPRRGDDPKRLAEALEGRLLDNPHYAYARGLGQLGPVVARPVTDGARRHEAALVARGTPAGAIKPPGLHGGDFWPDVFPGATEVTRFPEAG